MADAFHEVRFPTQIARRATGGPERRTEVVTLSTGAEERNSRWADSRRRYEVGYGIRTLDEIHAVIAFFEERRGRLTGFRFKDHADFRSGAPLSTPTPMDQAIGVGDGATRTFMLVKRYGSGATAWVRAIAKPVAGSVRVAVAGVETPPAKFTVDTVTGAVTFAADATPAAGRSVTAGFEFDVPVRFDTDRLAIDLAAFQAGDIPSIPLVEIRP
jgi:uncharacterized protein (TIGR02217 family)